MSRNALVGQATMFDVSWTGPAVETNGQRRKRKEREEATGTTRRASVKSSSSSGASAKATSAQGAGWAFFGKNSSKNTADSKSSSLSASKSSRAKDGPVLMSGGKAAPQYNNDPVIDRGRDNDRDFPRGNDPTSPSATMSTFSGAVSNSSGWQSRYNATDSTWSESVPGSKQDDLESRASRSVFQDDYSLEQSMREFGISEGKEYPDDVSEVYPSFPTPTYPRNTSRPLQQGRERSSSRNRLNDSDLDNSLPSSSQQMSSRFQNRPLPNPPPRTSSRNNLLRESDAQGSNQSEETTIQRSIRRMEAASARIVLERLREEWEEVTDARIYKELEMEKKLWMLTGLKVLLVRKKVADEVAALARGPPFTVSSPPVGKLLSLYENQASATYFSATFPSSEIHHAAANPCTGIQIPSSQLRGLVISTPVSPLPYPTATFSAISCLPLVSILTSPELPVLIRECYRVLEPQGLIKLIIMDPMPLSSTMGPITQEWFDEHLAMKLETKFRCRKPTRLVPVWLREVGFSIGGPAESTSQAPTSTKPRRDAEGKTVTLTFPTVARGEGNYRAKDSSKRDQATQSKRDIEMLTSTVGRMLWKELWGEYVVGRRWWWEDEDVVEECLRLKTRWDVMFIEGLKLG